MQFGIDKCAMLVMKKGKTVKSDGIELAIEKVVQSLKEGGSYKCLGVLEAGEVIVNEMKDKVKSEKSVGNKVKHLDSASGAILCSINRVVKTSTRGN